MTKRNREAVAAAIRAPRRDSLRRAEARAAAAPARAAVAPSSEGNPLRPPAPRVRLVRSDPLPARPFLARTIRRLEARSNVSRRAAPSPGSRVQGRDTATEGLLAAHGRTTRSRITTATTAPPITAATTGPPITPTITGIPGALLRTIPPPTPTAIAIARRAR